MNEEHMKLDERWYINKNGMAIKIFLLSIQTQNNDEIDIRYCLTYGINDLVIDIYGIEKPVLKLPDEIDKFEYQNKELSEILAELSNIFECKVKFLTRVRNTSGEQKQ